MDIVRTNHRDGRMVLDTSSGRSHDPRMDSARPPRKEKEKLRIVSVSWIDSYTDGGWAEYAPEKVETKTYGILVEKNKEWTTLAMTKEKGYWGNLWYIPTKNVVKVTPIAELDE